MFLAARFCVRSEKLKCITRSIENSGNAKFMKFIAEYVRSRNLEDRSTFSSMPLTERLAKQRRLSYSWIPPMGINSVCLAREDNSYNVSVKVAGIFERRQVAYALGSPITLAVWGSLCDTLDYVEVNVFGVDKYDIIRILSEEFGVDPEKARKEAYAKGLITCHMSGVEIVVHVNHPHLHENAQRTSVLVPLENEHVRVMSAEYLCIFKMLYFGTKHQADVENVLIVHGQHIDRQTVRQTLLDNLGGNAADPRIKFWDKLIAEGDRSWVLETTQ